MDRLGEDVDCGDSGTDLLSSLLSETGVLGEDRVSCVHKYMVRYTLSLLYMSTLYIHIHTHIVSQKHKVITLDLTVDIRRSTRLTWPRGFTMVLTSPSERSKKAGPSTDSSTQTKRQLMKCRSI